MTDNREALTCAATHNVPEHYTGALPERCDACMQAYVASRRRVVQPLTPWTRRADAYDLPVSGKPGQGAA